MTETDTSREMVDTLAQGHDDDDMHFTADVLRALLARAEKAEAENKRLREALQRMIQTMDAITDKAWCDSVSMDEVVAVEEEMSDARDAMKGSDQ